MSTENIGLRVTAKRLNGKGLTPVSIFQRLKGSYKFLLESSSKEKTSGRYSFIGANPLKSYKGHPGGVVEISHSTGNSFVHDGELFSLLKRLMPRVADETEFPFTGGAVGYVGYNASQDRIEEASHAFPAAYFNVYDTIIVFDHQQNGVVLLHNEIHPSQEKPDLDQLAASLLTEEIVSKEPAALGGFQSRMTQETFEEKVQQVIDRIHEGEVEQVVLSRQLEADFEGEPFELYQQLRKQNPSPYMYYMEFDDHIVIGASPESLVRVQGNKVQANPIAGTIRRGVNLTEDKLLEKSLRTNAKELAEHDMLVELAQDEMRQFCIPDTVEVTSYQKTVRYEYVMHLVSEVEGTLASGFHPLDTLQTSAPAGTVTGSPKPTAVKIIEELESEPRGIHHGAIGYIGLNGNIDFALTIRTLVLKEGKASLRAGAGIVAGSVPRTEYEETVNKAKSLTSLGDDLN